MAGDFWLTENHGRFSLMIYRTKTWWFSIAKVFDSQRGWYIQTAEFKHTPNRLSCVAGFLRHQRWRLMTQAAFFFRKMSDPFTVSKSLKWSDIWDIINLKTDIMFQELQMINLPHENMLFFHRGDIISYLFMAQSLNQLWDRVHRFFLMAKIKWDQQVYDG